VSSSANPFSPPAIALEPGRLRYNPCGDLIFPSVLRVRGLLENPLGACYMYYAPHDPPGGISLAYADAPTGPWIEYPENPLKRVSEPCLLVEEDTVYLFRTVGRRLAQKVAVCQASGTAFRRFLHGLGPCL
jgi:hypothetical protein